MPALAPFRGIRYAVRAPALSSLLAPPYDVISPEQRDALAASDPHNVVHLILDKERAGDDIDANKYTRAGQRFRAWLDEGVLRRDTVPAIYPLEQQFEAPDGRPTVRRGFIAAVRLHDYRDSVVLPHESTLEGPKVDRFELIKRVHANLSPIFCLYEDENGAATHALAPAFAGEVVAEAGLEGVHHRMWRVEDPDLVAAVQRILRERKLLIADGHHRYETALAYRDWLDARTPGLPANGGHHSMLVFLCSMGDPGLFIYPTHRGLTGLRGFNVADLLGRLSRLFVVDTLAEDVRRPAGRAWAFSKLAEHFAKATAFVMVTAEDQRARVLTLRDDADLGAVALPRNANLRALDVTILHGVVLESILGLSRESIEREENVRYFKDAGDVVARTLAGQFQVSFLVNPTPMWQVQAVGEAGETMPQKSTSFFPKIPSGLVFRDIDPRGPP